MNSQKAIIFDAGTLITFAMNGLYPELKALREIFKGKFLITQEVKSEVIDRPINTKRFELEALKIQELLSEGIIEMPSSLEIKDKEISENTNDLLKIANSTFEASENKIKIVDLGETSCLALSKILSNKGIKNVIAIDERTTRMLSEKPENLKNLLQKKLKTRVNVNPKNYDYFKDFKFIRSAELVYVAYKKGLIKLKGQMVLDALLYAVQFKGCAISGDEIREIEKIG
jgi:hypothetical protein